MIWHKRNIEQLSKLLENQKSLTTLRIGFYGFDVQNLQLDLQPDLRVNQLSVRHLNDYNRLLVLPVVLQFGTKVECLKYLGQNFGRYKVPNIRKVLQHYKTVKALSLYELPNNENFYGTVPVNTKLTKLVVVAAIRCKALLSAFKIFPRLKKLSIFAERLNFSELTHEEREQLHGNLDQLEKFTVALRSERDFCALKLLAPKITDLYLEMDNSPIDYNSFVAFRCVCKNASFLSISDIEGNFDSNFDLGKFLECAPELTTLQLSFVLVDIFKSTLMKLIKEKAKNLTTLKLQHVSKDFVRTLNQEAGFFGVEGLSITRFEGHDELSIYNNVISRFD